jgi:hypothetical protein
VRRVEKLGKIHREENGNMNFLKRLFSPEQTRSIDLQSFAHFIVEKGALRLVFERESLEKALRTPEMRYLLDLSDKKAEELLSTGRTTVKTLQGPKAEVTLTGCNCPNMSSHRREGDAQYDRFRK